MLSANVFVIEVSDSVTVVVIMDGVVIEIVLLISDIENFSKLSFYKIKSASFVHKRIYR